MSEAQVTEILQAFPTLDLHRPDSVSSRIVAQEADTSIYLDFEDSTLRTFQVSWISGFTKRSFGLIHDLCSGIKYVELRLVGNEELAGAEFWLDENLAGLLGKSGHFQQDVPIGSHSLRVEKPGVGVWRTQLEYDESSSGYDRLPIEALAENGK